MRDHLMAVRIVAGAIAVALLLGACTYDYLQRTDRVAYQAGDAVKANIARETDNPSKKSMYSTKGLGKDGALSPVEPGVGLTSP